MTIADMTIADVTIADMMMADMTIADVMMICLQIFVGKPKNLSLLAPHRFSSSSCTEVAFYYHDHHRNCHYHDRNLIII